MISKVTAVSNIPIGQVLYQSAGWISNIRFSPRGDQIAFMDHPALWDTRVSFQSPICRDMFARCARAGNPRAAWRGGLTAKKSGSPPFRRVTT